MGLMANTQIQSLVKRYDELERRDRIALNGLGAFFGVLFLYLLAWVPANDFLVKNQQNHDRQLSLIEYLRASEKQARSAGKAAPSVDGQSLLSTVSGSAQKFNIKPNRLQPEGSDGVSVWFNAVGFNKLIRWLEDLSKQGFVVKQISIDREEESGTVNARIILRS